MAHKVNGGQTFKSDEEEQKLVHEIHKQDNCFLQESTHFIGTRGSVSYAMATRSKQDAVAF